MNMQRRNSLLGRQGMGFGRSYSDEGERRPVASRSQAVIARIRKEKQEMLQLVDASAEMAPWFVSGTPRQEVRKIALEILKMGDVGEFIVRDVESEPECLGLSVKMTATDMSNFLIIGVKGGGNKAMRLQLRGARESFVDLTSLINFYCKSKSRFLGVQLIIPKFDLFTETETQDETMTQDLTTVSGDIYNRDRRMTRTESMPMIHESEQVAINNDQDYPRPHQSYQPFVENGERRTAITIKELDRFYAEGVELQKARIEIQKQHENMREMYEKMNDERESLRELMEKKVAASENLRKDIEKKHAEEVTMKQENHELELKLLEEKYTQELASQKDFYEAEIASMKEKLFKELSHIQGQTRNEYKKFEKALNSSGVDEKKQRKTAIPTTLEDNNEMPNNATFTDRVLEKFRNLSTELSVTKRDMREQLDRKEKELLSKIEQRDNEIDELNEEMDKRVEAERKYWEERITMARDRAEDATVACENELFKLSREANISVSPARLAAQSRRNKLRMDEEAQEAERVVKLIEAQISERNAAADKKRGMDKATEDAWKEQNLLIMKAAEVQMEGLRKLIEDQKTFTENQNHMNALEEQLQQAKIQLGNSYGFDTSQTPLELQHQAALAQVHALNETSYNHQYEDIDINFGF
eukprot:m.13010 g.13010  ORF g.13010 m.13010 type:complete len:645 (-) comp4770_c0_seq2:113-2047(-)